MTPFYLPPTTCPRAANAGMCFSLAPECPSWCKDQRGVPTACQTFVLTESPGLCSFQQQVINENYHLSNGNNAIIPKGKAMGAQSICRKLEQRQQGSPMSLGLYSVTDILRCPLHPAVWFQALEPKLSNSQPDWRLWKF